MNHPRVQLLLSTSFHEDLLSLLDLLIQRLLALEQVDQLAIVHLQQHARDLACQTRLDLANAREQRLTQQLLLLLRRGSSQVLDRQHAIVGGRSWGFGSGWAGSRLSRH